MAAFHEAICPWTRRRLVLLVGGLPRWVAALVAFAPGRRLRLLVSVVSAELLGDKSTTLRFV
eukprot:405533-Pleurochrysis_carterae.AAC.1